MNEDAQVPQDRSGTSPPEISVAPQPPRPSAKKPEFNLLGWIYAANPFYVLSAWLVFFGLRSSFDTTGDAFQSNALMLGLTGYTVLLAAAACFLVRFGKVWDDVRTMLLLVVLMFLAISVCFDDTLASNPRLGMLYYLGGWAFAVVVSEALLFGMPLRLPAGYRVPYHLMLALFFLYPIALSPMIHRPDDPALQWGLFGFSAAAGAIFLTLLPAARSGAASMRRSNPPWPWPLYPWVLFGTLGLGVLGRAYYLCYSLHFVGDSINIFGTYFWVPFLLAVCVVAVEGAVASGRRGWINFALALPLVVIVVSGSQQTPRPIDYDFAERFQATVGATPLFVTLVAVAALHAVCWLRRIPRAVDALSITLLAFTVVGPKTPHVAALSETSILPLAAVAVLQFGTALGKTSRLRVLAAAVCVLAGSWIGLEGTAQQAYGAAAMFHLGLLTLMAAGVLIPDQFGRFLQAIGALMLVAGGGVAVGAQFVPELYGRLAWAEPFVAWYPWAAIAAAVVYVYLGRNRGYYAAAGVIAAAWLVPTARDLYQVLREIMVGLDYVLVGLLVFAVAMLVSLSKVPAVQRWLKTEFEPEPPEKE
jgi:hypothetical protein